MSRLRAHQFLGVKLVRLDPRRAVLARKVYVDGGKIAVLRPDGSVAVNDARLFKFALPDHPSRSLAGIADALLKMGAVNRKLAQAYLTENDAARKRQEAYYAARDLQQAAKTAGVALTAAQKRKLKSLGASK